MGFKIIYVLYVFIPLVCYLAYREYKFYHLLNSAKLDIPENFFNSLNYEIECLCDVDSYIMNQNWYIDRITIPPLDTTNLNSYSSENLRNGLNYYFAKENLQAGVSHFKINQLPYFKKISAEKSVIITANFLISKIPTIKNQVIIALETTRNINGHHNKLISFWNTLIHQINKLDKRTKNRFERFCENCYNLLLNVDDIFSSINERNKTLSFNRQEFNIAKNVSGISSSDWIDIGLVSGLTYFVLDLDDIDLVDTFIDEVVSEQILDTLGDIVDTTSTIAIPFISILRESRKQIRLKEQGLTTAKESVLNGSVSVGSRTVGALGGGKIGASVGTLFLPGVGTFIGGLAGGIMGAIAGVFVSNSWKIERYEKARQKFNSFKAKFSDFIRDSLSQIYVLTNSRIEKLQRHLSRNLLASKIKKSKTLVERPLKERALEAINADIVKMHLINNKLTKYRRNKAKAIQVKIHGAIQQYELLAAHFNSNKNDVSNNEVRSFFREVPVLKGGTVDKFLVQDKKILTELNCNLSIGLIIWYLKTIQIYDNSVFRLTRTFSNLCKKHEGNITAYNNKLSELQQRAVALRAQING